MIIGLVAMTLTALPAAANAQCESFIGSTIEPQDIDDIFQPFVQIGPKGEFETTAAYEARRERAITGLGATLIVHKEPEDGEYITYDADQQTLNVMSYAFDNAGLNSDALFGHGAPYEGIVQKRLTNFEVVIEEDETVTDTYQASNSYGAETEVSKIFRRTRGIFEGPSRSSSVGLFPNADSGPYFAGSISMSPERAQQIKPTIQLAFVVAPAAPYYISAIYDYPKNPTITNPREVRNEVSVMIADIQCGLVLTAESEVLGAFPTR